MFELYTNCPCFCSVASFCSYIIAIGYITCHMQSGQYVRVLYHHPLRPSPALDLKGLTNFLRLCRSSKSQDLGGYIAAPTETENASQALRTGLNNVLLWALEAVTSLNMLTFSCFTSSLSLFPKNLSTLINHDKPFWKKLGQLLLQQLLMLSQQCSAASLMFFVFLEP